MRACLPDLELRTIRIHYVMFCHVARTHNFAPSRYKCFRCRILAWRGDAPPYLFSRRTPCPHNFRYPSQVCHRCEWLPRPKSIAFVVDSEGLFCYHPPSLVECPVHGSCERHSEALQVASNPTRLWAQGQKTPLRPFVRAAKMTGFALRSLSAA